MKLVMLGASGVGKGTQAKLLSQRYSIPQISTGDILREAKHNGTALGQRVKAILDRGELVSDQIVNELVEERIQNDDCKNGFILDGYPRTIGQAETLEGYLKGYENGLKVVLLEVPESMLIQRLVSRRHCNNCKHDFNIKEGETDITCPNCGSNDILHRADDNYESIQKRFKSYETATEPLIDYYADKDILLRFDGRLEVEELQQQIIESLET